MKTAVDILTGYGLARLIDLLLQRPHMCDVFFSVCQL